MTNSTILPPPEELLPSTWRLASSPRIRTLSERPSGPPRPWPHRHTTRQLGPDVVQGAARPTVVGCGRREPQLSGSRHVEARPATPGPPPCLPTCPHPPTTRVRVPTQSPPTEAPATAPTVRACAPPTPPIPVTSPPPTAAVPRVGGSRGLHPTWWWGGGGVARSHFCSSAFAGASVPWPPLLRPRRLCVGGGRAGGGSGA